jgi:hypothetical protein
MSGTTFLSDISIGMVPVEWSVAAVADLNGDGYADTLWQNSTTGERYVWFMNNINVIDHTSLGTVSSSWVIVN